MQERRHAFAGRFDQELVSVFADILPKEVEPLADMSDLGFLRRELEPSFSKEGLNGWFYLLFEDLFTDTGDNEVVRVADDVPTEA